jgi:hypothetical protein
VGSLHGKRSYFGMLDVDLKTIQEILLHAHSATKADIYVKEVSADSVAAMMKLEQKVGSHIEAAIAEARPKPASGSDYSAANVL